MNLIPLQSYKREVEINNLPPVQSAITQLPYNNLTHNWEEFEQLILELVEDLEGSDLSIVELYKTRGSKQEGIDIFKLDQNHDFEKVYQCKRYKKLSSFSLKKAVKDFKDGKFSNCVKEFVIATSADVSLLLEEIQNYKKDFQQEGKLFDVWGPTKLDKFLKSRPKIVHRFFDGNRLPAQWVQQFCGEEHLKNLEYKGLKKITYNFNGDYIERLCNKTIVPEKNQGFSWTVNVSLKEFLQQQSNSFRILLRSSPGMGKSTELDFLANQIFENKLRPEKYPFRYNLKNYSSGSIVDKLERVYPHWKYVKKRLILLLDGFDEIPSTSQLLFKQSLREFLDSNSDVSVIISVRHNSTPDNLDGFESIDLLPLADYQVRKYLFSKLNKKNELAVNHFLSECRRLKIQDLLENPFELTCLVDVFNESGELANNKFNLLQKVREQRFLWEKSKERFSDLQIRIEHNKLLRELSLVLMLLDKQDLEEEDLLDLFGSNKNIELIKNSPFVHFDNDEFSFIHNNFKEFYLSEAISQMSFDQIKALICFREGETLKPKWKNGLSFFFANESNGKIQEQLSEFIFEKDKLYFVGMEKGRIPFQKRMAFFKEVLKDLSTYFFKSVSIEELFSFIDLNERPDAANYILQKIKEDKNILNGLYVLKSLYNPFNLKEQIKKVLGQIISNPTHEPQIHRFSIEILHELEILDEEQLDLIFERKPSFSNINLRASILRHLHSKNRIGDYLSFVFDTIWQRESDGKNDGYYSYWYVFDGLKKVKELDKVLEILNEINKLFAANHVQWLNGQKEFLEAFFSNLKSFGKNTEVRDRLIETILTEKNYVLRDFWLKPSFKYLKEVGYAEYAFWKIWQECEQKVWSLGPDFYLLISKTTINNMVNKLNSSIDKEEEAYRYIHVLDRKQERIFINMVNSQETFGLNLVQRKTYVDTYEKDKKNEIALLEDKASFLKNLKKDYFSEKNKITLEELRDRSLYEIADRSIITWGFLEDRCNDGNGTVTYNEIEKYLNPKKTWDAFVLYELGEILVHRKELLTKEQLSYIESLTMDLLPLDFKNAKGMNPDGSHWYGINENKFCIYFQHLRPKTDKETILDLLSNDATGIHSYQQFDNQVKPLTEVIREELNNDQRLKDRVLLNLKEGVDFPDIIGTHFRLCHEFKIYDSVNLLSSYLLNEKLGSWHMEKGIEIFLELGGSLRDFSAIPWEFKPEKSWHWFVIEKQFNQGLYKDKIVETLEALNYYGEDNKHLSVARDLLMKSLSLKGLKLFRSIIEESNHYSFRSNEELENLLANFPTQESEPIFKILYDKASQSSDVFNDRMDFFINSAVKASLLHNSFYEVILSYFSKDNEKNHIQRHEENFKKEYWMKKVEFKSISEVSQFLEKNLKIEF